MLLSHLAVEGRAAVPEGFMEEVTFILVYLQAGKSS